ncbi:MAG TPA: signal peptidase II [Sulfurovum sp.]|jgi:signal peptidase II|nr:MAG: signal peptidase II [Sulfurovum sp. 35-42-20]OYY56002.1 MAG: signal peptidase II [Sulfurovum sp. 28-43-6]OYZ26399.1 MAG: signal peptidase II [Sulfurovum sp. 16-42-52]OYZ49792.1 MAG: signal peptidase II [Sulfurovum sp. 24-42-9]OZA46399.1 MAG: signal peptidase II [Sulfurovum sp. 17-42-90]OZA60153.1 MAG: signal peptidase II [Sulfurovum sp. 39-42-12]HQR73774.1 signal peptidase II [Sulfurovum sp.]
MRVFALFFLVLLGTFVVDQTIKTIFVEGFYRAGECINLELHYNKGVAFSMFAFLGPYLKWIQALLVVGIFIFVVKEGYLNRFSIPLGMLLGGALGNVYDRFMHEGVVDYVAWHCGFDFAVFNFADVAIDVAVVWILLAAYFAKEEIPKDTMDQ